MGKRLRIQKQVMTRLAKVRRSRSSRRSRTKVKS